MAWWKELPYRGQPPVKGPRPRKKTQTQKQKLRDAIQTVVVSVIGILFCVVMIIFVPNETIGEERNLILLFFFVLGILMVGFATWIEATNKYLSADDLEKPKEEREKE
jgi:uncharacterized membrane protein